MSLIDDICSDLTNESADIANTLRKAKILASAIGLPEFREWVDSELNGYPDLKKVPNYRRSRPLNLGTFSGSFQTMARKVPLPTQSLPSPVKEFAEKLVLSQGVGELEAMLNQGDGKYKREWPVEFVMLARDATLMTDGMILVNAHQPILPSHISGILDKVKNKLLDFILGLQEKNVTSENLKSGEVKQEMVRNLFHIHIYGDHNIVASGESVQQQANPIRKGDIASLVNHLAGHKVDENDLSELKRIVATEQDPSQGQFGPKVQAWVGKMIEKAASGAWKISLATAPKVLMDGIRSYYGG